MRGRRGVDVGSIWVDVGSMWGRRGVDVVVAVGKQ